MQKLETELDGLFERIMTARQPTQQINCNSLVYRLSYKQFSLLGPDSGHSNKTSCRILFVTRGP